MSYDETSSVVVDLHALWEADRPDEREYAERVEQQRRARHIDAHGSDDGYTPARSFPCPGALKREDERSPFVVCDVCRYEVSIPVEPRSVESVPSEGEW